jgi:hypothetical protein
MGSGRGEVILGAEGTFPLAPSLNPTRFAKTTRIEWAPSWAVNDASLFTVLACFYLTYVPVRDIHDRTKPNPQDIWDDKL